MAFEVLNAFDQSRKRVKTLRKNDMRIRERGGDHIYKVKADTTQDIRREKKQSNSE